MAAVKEQQDVYFSHFSELQKKLAGREPAWVSTIRRAAFERFAELGFPTTHDEEWKYTSVAAIARLPFRPAPEVTDGLAPVLAESLDRSPFAKLGCPRLVFVNGRYRPALSSPEALPGGIKAGSLAETLAGDPSFLEQHLARYAAFEDQAFVALNTALMADGAWIEIPKGMVLAQPVLLLHISASDGRPMVSHPRNLILAGRESQAAIVEGYLGLGDGICFTNAVTEVVAGEGAIVEYGKVQDESGKSFHVATLQFEQACSSSVHSHTIQMGSALDREDLRAVLNGEGAECTLNGIYVTSGQQHVDNHTTIDHAKPHCGSRELYKGVLDGKSTGVFNGKIIVRKDAQKTDSKQSNKNLLLSEDAGINTKPQLEIYADDVKCTHGATIGQVDPEAVFYLRSRGIGAEEARAMLTQAFASEVIGRIKFQPLRARLNEALSARLAKIELAQAKTCEGR